MFPILTKILDGYQWCIAGGWAACPALATDIDVWVYDVDVETHTLVAEGIMGAIRAEIAKLNTQCLPYPERRYSFTDEFDADPENAHGYIGFDITIQKVGVLTFPRLMMLQPIHIMLTDAQGPNEVLCNFDVSTHAVAIDSSGRVHMTLDRYTHPGEPPRALRVNPHTPERMARIATRFGHPIPEMTIAETDTEEI